MKELKLPLIFAAISAGMTLLGNVCELTSGPGPFACIPLLLPALPILTFFPSLGQSIHDTMSVIIAALASAVFWFVVVGFITFVIGFPRKKNESTSIQS